MKYSNDDGYVLLLVLVIIQILTIIGYYEFSTISDLYQSAHQESSRESLLNQSVSYLSRLAIEPSYIESCSVPFMSANTLLKQSSAWWHERPCSGNFFENQYDYVIESLGNDACSIFSENEKPLKSAEFYRVTLYALNKSKKIHIMIQAIYALPADRSDSCNGLKHNIGLGLQSWREIG